MSLLSTIYLLTLHDLSAHYTLHYLLCTIYYLLCTIYSAQFTLQCGVTSDECGSVSPGSLSSHLPSPTFSALLLTHATVQTTLHAMPPSLHFLLVAAPSLRSLNVRKARPLGNAYFLELLHPTAATAATGDQI